MIALTLLCAVRIKRIVRVARGREDVRPREQAAALDNESRNCSQ